MNESVKFVWYEEGWRYWTYAAQWGQKMHTVRSLSCIYGAKPSKNR